MQTKQKPSFISYPKDWSEIELGEAVEVNSESLGVGTPQKLVFRYIDISSVDHGVIDWNTVTLQMFQSSPSRARRIVRPNDVLLCTVRPGLQAHTFANWQELDGYICSTGFVVLRANSRINSRFLYHLIFSEIVASQIRQCEVGSNYPAINETDVKELKIPLPSTSEEQQKIAHILDTIDNLITLTDRHIAKLKLARAGLLHDLLTRGIDENGELRDPIEYPEQFKETGTAIGLIAKNWDVSRLDSLVERITSGSRWWARYYSDYGALFIRIGNLTREHLNLRLNEIMYVCPPSGSEGERTRVKTGDVLISVTADLGIIGVIPENFGEAYVNQHIALVRLKQEDINPQWIGLYLSQETGQRQFRQKMIQVQKLGLICQLSNPFLLHCPNVKNRIRLFLLLTVMTTK